MNVISTGSGEANAKPRKPDPVIAEYTARHKKTDRAKAPPVFV